METRFPLQTDDATPSHKEEADAHRDNTRENVISVTDTGNTLPPPPVLTSHYSHLAHSIPGADLLHIIQYLEQMRQQDETKRHQTDELRRQQENSRFTALIQLLVSASPQAISSQADATGSGAPATTSPVPAASPSTSSSVPPPQKAVAQNPSPLQADATFQVFREWRRPWDDYSVMVDLFKLPRQKQLIQLRMCLTLETQRVLEHTLDIPSATD